MTARSGWTLFAAAGAAALLFLTGSPATAQKKPTLNSVDRRFILKAGEGNVAEVMVSRLALQKSKNGDVREVAQMLVKEHSMANDKLKKIAAMKGMRVPSRPSPKHQAAYRRLSRMSSTAFNKMYLSGQIKDHLNTIALFQSTIRAGRDADVQGFARENLPPIQNHTVHIVKAAEKVGVRPIPREARAYVR